MPKIIREKNQPDIPEIVPEDVEIHEITEPSFGAESEASLEHPNINEDAFFIDKKINAAGIFDGMGGYGGGNIASEAAAGAVLEKLNELPDNASVKKIQQTISLALKTASQEILDMQENDPEKLKNMGATGTVMKIWEGKNGEKKAVIGNVGDSRAYLLRNGRLQALTKDDSLVQQLIDEGQLKNDQDLNAEAAVDMGLGKQKIKVGKIRHAMLQGLGVDAENHLKINPNMYTVDLESGDTLLLSSDGIHDNLLDKEIEMTLKNGFDEKDLAELLVRRAALVEIDKNNPRNKPDDKTAIIIKI